MKFLLSRWQLKSLALLMAIALYFFTGTQITIERTFTIQVPDEQLRGLPANYLLSRLAPREFDITVAGPKSLIEGLSASSIEPLLTIGTDGLTTGYQEFDITERLLRLNPALALRSSSVDRIRAEFSRLIEDVLSLEGRPAISGLPDGLRAEVSLVRSQVLVQGPANEIALLQQRGPLSVRAIDLSMVPSGLVETMQMTVPLVIEVPDVGIHTVEQPEAVVRISPALETRVVGPLAVNVLAGADILTRYEVEIAPPSVALTISGPANRLAEGDPAAQIRAFVDVIDVRRSGVGEERTVRILAPPWMTTTTTSVVVTIRPRGENARTLPDSEALLPEPPQPLENEPQPPSPPNE